MKNSVFIYSPIEGYFGCSEFLVIGNIAAINIHVHIFVWA
jgi:hypothetical protein